jgi:hypothetical protein
MRVMIISDGLHDAHCGGGVTCEEEEVMVQKCDIVTLQK